MTGSWREACDWVCDRLVAHYGDRLDSLYVRGTVAEGRAVEGLSDVDIIILFRPGERADNAFMHRLKTDFAARFPALGPLGAQGFDRARLLSDPARRGARDVLKLSCACLRGEDAFAALPPVRLGPHLALEIEALPRLFRWAKSERDAGRPLDGETRRGLAKAAVRAGFQLVMMKERIFTRDLRACAAAFTKHYPDRAAQMEMAVDQALSPAEGEAFLAPMTDFVRWLLAEAEREEWRRPR